MLEAKSALEERFKNLASSDQILDSSSNFGAKANSSTPDYYMFRALEEVVSSAVVTRAQYMSRAMPSTTREFVDILRARNMVP